MWMFVVVVLVGVVRVPVVSTVIPVRVAVNVLADAQRDKQHTGHETHRPTNLETTENRDWVVDLREIEVCFRVEEHRDHRNTADEVADTDDEAGSEAIHPLVRLVESV